MTDLYDFDADNIRALSKGAELAELNKLAVEKALQSHPVTKYVRDLPFEPLEMYPAISGTYQSIMGSKKTTGIRNCDRIWAGIPNMFWTLPAHDKTKQKNGRCGVFASSKGDIPMTACSLEKTHSVKAIGNHCWSMHCVSCMNSTALRMGVKSETKIMAPGDIRKRKTGTEDPISHYQISPPQEWAKKVIQNSHDFSCLFDDIVKICEQNGLTGGAIVFHPWRQHDLYKKIEGPDGRLHCSEERTEWPSFITDGNGDLLTQYRNLTSVWAAGPHFHVIAYGRFTNTDVFRKNMAYIDSQKCIWTEDGNTETWVVKKIHSGEKIRSVRQSLAYLLTHAGLGSYYYDPDWDLEAENILIPARIEGNSVTVKEASATQYAVDWESTGWYAEHFDLYDFLKWTKERMSAAFQSVRYFGSANGTRVFGVHKETHIRECPVCGSAMKRYQTACDCTPETATYVHESKIRTLKSDYDLVKARWDLGDIRKEGISMLDFAISVPQCSTPETMGVQDYDPNETPAERKKNDNRVIAYVRSGYGVGLEPVLLTREEYDRINSDTVNI